MRFFNWLFGHKKKTPYTPWVEFGTGATVKLPEDVNEYVKFTKCNSMIDPNQPAFPTMHSIDGNWQKWPLKQYQGLTIRAELAARFTAALIGKLPAEDGRFEIDVINGGFALADEFIRKLNETT